MKKTVLFLAIISLVVSCLQAQNVNIPDANFKAYLVGETAINTNSDSEIQLSEATAFTGAINCFNMGIEDFTGIEAFTSITSLICAENDLTTPLDVSSNTALTTLYCYSNQLTTLDVRQNTDLTTLNCSGNNLTTLDVSQNTKLTALHCYNNQLISLDIRNGNNTNMSNPLFIATGNPNLTCIQVDDSTYSANNWTNIDAGASFSEDCSVSWCTIDIPDMNFKSYLVGETAINTNGDSEIQCAEAASFTGTIDAYSLGISDLTGIEAFTSLTSLSCYNNQLTSLDLSNNTALTHLYCNNNQLMVLDLSNNTNLVHLYAYDNQITSLDLSNHTALTRLDCSNNNLITLNIANGYNTEILFFDASNNNLDCIEVDDATYSSANWTSIDAGTGFSDGNPDMGTDVQTACGSYTWIDGITYTASNNTATYQVNCDSIVTLDLTINIADTSVTQSGETLTANASGATYRWLDCNDSYSEIPGEASQIFVPTATGNFALEVTVSGCTDTSSCFSVIISGLTTVPPMLSNVYPNPVNDVLYIDSRKSGEARIVNLFGQTTAIKILKQGNNRIDVSRLGTGVYFLQTTNGSVVKFVKQ